MNIQQIGEPCERRLSGNDHSNPALRQMTPEQLLYLGSGRVVYLKAGLRDGEMLFVAYGADGMPMVAADDVDAVVEMAIERGLAFVAVH